MAALEKVALALSDPIRLRIMDLLEAGRNQTCCSPAEPDLPQALCSCDLLPVLNLAPSRLSYHMKELKEAGLITEQKRGRWVYFAINREAVAAFADALVNRFVTEKEQLPVLSCAPPLIQLDTLLEENGAQNRRTRDDHQP